MRLETIGNGGMRAGVEGCSKAPNMRVVQAGSIATELSYGCDVSAAAESNGNVSAEVVYKPSTHPYLHVLPEHMMWVDVGLDFDYSVYSNTNWIIN